MKDLTAFWKDKKCLITGGIGFIGSHLCKRLHDAGAQVVVIDKEVDHAGTLFSLLNSARNIAVITQDLSDPASIRIAQKTAPDYIFHLAALPYAPYTTLHSQETYASNVVSTVNMLEAARLSPSPKFILASSACVFGAAQHSPLRVSDKRYIPEHYYSVTKQEAEKQVDDYQQQHGVDAVVCRFGNIYGPGDRHFGRIVPQVCCQLINEKRDTLRLNRSRGDSVFEFLYVDDAVEGLVMAAEKQLNLREALHFSSGVKARISILDMVSTISECFDGKRRSIIVNSVNPEKRVKKYLDTTETEHLLGFEARWDLDTGLRETVEWYKHHINSIAPYHDHSVDG